MTWTCHYVQCEKCNPSTTMLRAEVHLPHWSSEGSMGARMIARARHVVEDHLEIFSFPVRNPVYSVFYFYFLQCLTMKSLAYTCFCICYM
jgi:hypothetical protein